MPRADGIKYDCLSFSRLVHIHRNTPMRGTKKAMTLRIMLPWVASSVKSALHTGQVFDSLGIIAPQYSHFFKSFFIRKVIICEPPFEAVQLNIQYL